MRTTTHVSFADRAHAASAAVVILLAAPLTITAPLAAQGRLADEATIIRVAKQATPAVVSVTDPGVGLGSGVIIRADGVIITNAHVVGTATRVEVGLADGRQIPGQVLGRDPSVDIAVVRVQLTGLPTAPLGNSDQIEVGQTAIAIGNPVGLDRTVTTGIISAINRSPRGFELGGLIQTDAAINPGNSGGPLLDSQGRVIGINSAILQGTTGLGFAIPINLAQEIANQVLTTGHITRPYLGINPADLSPEIADRFNLPVREGVIIRTVDPRAPAGRAGLQPGDIIVSINNGPTRTASELLRVLRLSKPGDTIRIGVVRLDENGHLAGRTTVSVQLASAPVE
ncbi:MAG: S1C family serine protease [Gemmatimonadaceae bacterium]